MSEEFNLSEKKGLLPGRHKNGNGYYREEDVKEFIRLLKEEIEKTAQVDGADNLTYEDIIHKIDKLAGEKLR